MNNPNDVILMERPEILSRLHNHRCLVIEAHAGTGKTYTIEHLVIDLLIHPTNPYSIKEILIVTFTDKAARELRARVRKMIEKILYSPPALCPPDKPNWKIDHEARSRLQFALFSFEEAQISTIHGFCQRVLRDTAFLSGGAMERKLGSIRMAYEKAFAQLLRETFAHQEPYKTFLDAWLEQQTLDALKNLIFQALQSNTLKPGLLKPVALSGTLEPQKFEEKIEALYEIVVVRQQSFPSGNFRAIRNLIASLFLPEKTKINGNSGSADFFAEVEMFKNSDLCFWNKKNTPSETSASSNLKQMLRYIRHNESQIKDIIKDLATKLNSLAEKSPEKHQEITKVIEPYIYFLTTTFPALSEAILELFLPPLHERVEKYKNEQGLFDFEDLLTEVEKSLRDNSNGVCALLRDRFRLGLIDEFQDTDPVQWKIFKTIFADSDNHRLLVVGDPKQSIYRFRGADVQTYLEATAVLPREKLTKNFRSSPRIIDAYNIILSAKGTFFKNSGIQYKTPVECGDTKADILFSDGTPVQKPLRLVHIPSLNNKPRKATEYKSQLLRFIASEIKNILGLAGSQQFLGASKSSTPGKPMGFLVTSNKKQTPEPLLAKDIFVLTSSNTEAELVARELRRSGIPCTTVQNGSVFASEEAIEVSCLLDAIAEPTNRSLVSRACLGPFFECRLNNLDGVLSNENGEPWLSLRTWNDLSQRENLSRLFETILSETGLLRREIATSQSERTITNVLHIFESLQLWHTMENSTFEESRQRLKQAISENGENEDTESVQRLETDAQAVQILTMHKSKGLEAAVVFFFGGFSTTKKKRPQLLQNENRDRVFDTRDLPRNELIIAAQEAEENERVLYVALTRAGCMLYLPFFEKTVEKEKTPTFEIRLDGRYQQLAERLHQLAGNKYNSPCDSEERKQFSLLSEIVVPSFNNELFEKNTARNLQMPLLLLENWDPAQKILGNKNSATANADAANSVTADIDFAALRQQHAAPGARSYTSLKNANVSHNRKFDEQESDIAATSTPTSTPTSTATPAPSSHLTLPDLPRGAAFGVCFHEAMEKLDLEAVANSENFVDWQNSITTKEFLAKILTSHGFSNKIQDRFGSMVFESAKAIQHNAILRETRFHMPWPEHAHSAVSGYFKAERGFLVGAIDAIIEWENKYYVLDWKTDLLPSFEKDYCQQHVQKHYTLQAKIYTLALMRFLNIHSENHFDAIFAGHIYVFCRAPTPMTVHERLSWNEMETFQQQLKNADGFFLETEAFT